MRVTTMAAIGLALWGVACLVAVAWLTRGSGVNLTGASKTPILLLILGVALIYAGIRWWSFGGLLRKIAS